MLETILESFGLTIHNLTLNSLTGPNGLIYQEKFRENHDLEVMHLLQILDLFSNVADKTTLLKAMLPYVNSKNPHFTQLCNPCFLATLAQQNVELADMILNDETCLDIFLNDIDNFSTYFLAIAEKHTYFMYQYLRNQIHDPKSKQYELFQKLKADKSFRGIYSQLLSYADNFFAAAAADEFFYFMHVTDSFGKRDDLLKGDDANANLKIICRSKYNANSLLTTIFANKFRNAGYYADIELATLVEISKRHPENCHITLNVLQNQLNNHSIDSEEYTIYQGHIAELMPVAEKQAAQGHSPSVHLVAECALLGALSDDQDPASILIDHYDNYQDKATLDVIYHIAEAYLSGEFNSSKITKNIPTAYALLTYLTTKSKKNNAANELLTRPNAALEFAKAAEENGDLKQAFAICQNAIMPEKPSYYHHHGMHDLNVQKTVNYAQNFIAYIQIKSMELNLSKAFIESHNMCSPGTFNTLNKLDKKIFALTIGKILLNVNTHDLTKKNLDYCLDIALQLMANNSDQRLLACKLIQHIAKQSKQAANFLACFDQTLLNTAKQQSYEVTEIEMREAFLCLNETFSQLVQECQIKAENDIIIDHLSNNETIQNQYQAILALGKEISFLNKNIRQEILNLQNPEQYPDKMWNENLQRKLPVDLQNSIKQTSALRNTQRNASFWTSEPLKLMDDDFDCKRIVGSSLTLQN